LVFWLRYFQSLDRFHNRVKALSEITQLTGGRVFPVTSLNELPDIAAKIGLELRNQFGINI
jgi:hypothetical protein